MTGEVPTTGARQGGDVVNGLAKHTAIPDYQISKISDKQFRRQIFQSHRISSLEETDFLSKSAKIAQKGNNIFDEKIITMI